METVRGVLSLDVRSLILLRVCIGLIVFIDVARRADTIEFYTDQGAYIQQPGDTQHRCLFHQVWFWRGSWQLQTLLFAITGAAALCLSVGLWTPVANAATWVGIVAIHGRNECVNDSSDRMLRNVLFWCLILPLGAVGSVDRARQLRLRVGSDSSPHPAGWSCGEGWQHVSPGSAGLLFQIICLYLAVCWQRRHSREWWGPLAIPPFAGSSDSQVDFSAVYSMLGSPFAAKGLGKLLASSCPSLMWILTVFGDVVEVLAPFSLLTSTVGSWRRMVPVVALLGLQAGINSVLYLTSFGLIAGFTMVAFIPSPAWDWWLGTIPRGCVVGASQVSLDSPPVLRLLVDSKLLRIVTASEQFTDQVAIKKKTDEEPQLEWRPPVALAIALLFAGVATGGTGQQKLQLEPSELRSTGWGVVVHATEEQKDQQEDDEETRMRADLEVLSLPALHKRARDACSSQIEQASLEAALHSDNPKASLIGLLVELRLVDNGRVLVGMEAFSAVLQAGGQHAGQPSELKLREMLLAWMLDGLNNLFHDPFFCPCLSRHHAGLEPSLNLADSSGREGCLLKVWRLAERIARLARLIGGTAALMYMLMLNAAEVGVPGIKKFDGGDIGEVLRLNQNWVMYTPTPPVESGWMSVIGYEQTATGNYRAGEEMEPRAVDLLAALRTGNWSWSDPAAVEEALSGIPRVPALLYKSSRWEKMFENYLKLVHRPGSERGWGCAAGGKRERDARLRTLARWFCSHWEIQRIHSTAGQQIDANYPGSGRLGTVVVGVARTTNAYSPAVANRSIDDGWQGGFYRVIEPAKAKMFEFHCL